MELYFTQDIMDGLYELLDDITILVQSKTGEDLSSTFQWSGKVGEIEKLIEKVANAYTRQSLTDRLIRLVARARKTPNLRAHSFGAIQDWVNRISE